MAQEDIGCGSAYCNQCYQVFETSESLLVFWTYFCTNGYEPRYPIVFGSIIIVISLGLIQMAMDQNKQSQVNGCVNSIRALCYVVFIRETCRFMVMTGAGVRLVAHSPFRHVLRRATTVSQPSRASLSSCVPFLTLLGN